MYSEVIIIGAGAAGLMCAISAAERGKQVTIVDHANKAGKKILISGGGRCNFTNMYASPENYLSENPHFCKSALSRYTQWDFLAEVDNAEIPWHEEKVGHLFSDQKSSAILDMLLDKCEGLGVHIKLHTKIDNITQNDDKTFSLTTSNGVYGCNSLVVATGALSFPTMGATDFGHRIAKQFGINVTPIKPGLVPLTFDAKEKSQFKDLSGINFHCSIECNGQAFSESMVFTHKGISGPVVLQISSYWKPGDFITINCLPGIDLYDELLAAQRETPKKQLKNLLTNYLPQRLISAFMAEINIEKPIQEYKHQELEDIAKSIQQWTFIPSGTEGYKKAEVSVGGVDTNEVSSKTFEARKVENLYFIGEVLDVTGQLGGFNFQWAWSSGYCCAQAL